MLEYFISDQENGLNQIHHFVPGCWINMTSPSEEEIHSTATALDIPLNFLKNPLDYDERSRIQKVDQTVIIIVNIPYSTSDTSGFPLFETYPIGIIMTDNSFITVSSKNTPILDDFKNGSILDFSTLKRQQFALQILFAISSYYLKYLKHINQKTNEIEMELQQSLKNKEIYAFLALEKSLVYFTTSLKSNKIVLEKLLRQIVVKLNAEDKELLLDVIIENHQAIEMAETYSSILSGMMDAFASVISNNLNIVMKILTSITIILALPTIVASFFGMNVDLPFDTKPYAFYLILFISVLLSAVTTIVFWKKKFL